MKERPILFSDRMVRAILDDRKSQTRRVMKPQPSYYEGNPYICMDENAKVIRCPYEVGDRLWVREAWAIERKYDKYPGSKVPVAGREQIWYLADGTKPEWAGRTRSGRFMPRWASRIMLDVVKKRAEPVQEIMNNDALAEGTPDLRTIENGWDLRDCFPELWNSINAKRGFGWDVNPWVWVIEFKKPA